MSKWILGIVGSIASTLSAGAIICGVMMYMALARIEITMDFAVKQNAAMQEQMNTMQITANKTNERIADLTARITSLERRP